MFHIAFPDIEKEDFVMSIVDPFLVTIEWYGCDSD